MTNPRDSEERTERFLSDSEGWKEEAESIIQDVKDYVNEIRASQTIQVKNKCSEPREANFFLGTVNRK